jgi:SAM-dependent methyltransferase
MNLFKYLKRQLRRLKIDLLTQRTFLAGDVHSIDDRKIIKTANSNYEELEIIFFNHMLLTKTDVIIDVGCGKGRVFNYLLYKGLKNKMIGFEINPEVGLETASHLKRYENVEIRTEDIFDDFPAEGNIFYLYHPFKEEMMAEFRRRLLQIADRNPVMLYNNPVFVDLFDKQHFKCRMVEEYIAEFDYSFKFAVISVKQGKE